MTTYNDIIKLIDVNESADSTYTSPVETSDIETFSSLFGISLYWNDEFSNRMLKHWVASWVCTDTRVGLAVYCLDKVPVAISTQSARKNEERIRFVSEEAQLEVFKCIVSYMKCSDSGDYLIQMEDSVNPAWLHNVALNEWGFTKLP